MFSNNLSVTNTNKPSPLFYLDFYTENKRKVFSLILVIVSLVFILFVCIFIYMQIKVYYNHKKKMIFGFNSGRTSKKESFLTRDTSEHSVLQVKN